MKVGIIGLGVVGLSFASVLGSKRLSVIGMDSDLKKIEKITSKKSLFSSSRRVRQPTHVHELHII